MYLITQKLSTDFDVALKNAEHPIANWNRGTGQKLVKLGAQLVFFRPYPKNCSQETEAAETIWPSANGGTTSQFPTPHVRQRSMIGCLQSMLNCGTSALGGEVGEKAPSFSKAI